MAVRLHTVLTPVLMVVVCSALTSGSAQSVGPSAQQSVNQRSSQQPDQAKQILRTKTRLVVVDVVATDTKGQAITNLKADDFTVLENGHPQHISSFSFQGDGQSASAPVAMSVAVKLPQHVFTNVPQHRSNGAWNVILVDALNSTMLDQTDMRQRILKIVEKLPPDRPIAIYLLGTRLSLLQDFTSDPAVLLKIIENLKTERSPLLFNSIGGPDSDVMNLSSLPENLRRQAQHSLEQEIAHGTDSQVAITMQALTSLAHMLAGYPGRKNLIWISGAFPLTINPDTSLPGGKGNDFVRNYDGEIAKTANALMNSQIAVYPIEIRGLQSADLFRAGNDGKDKFGRGIVSTPGYTGDDLLAIHTAISDLADRTGGKATYYNNDIGKSVLNDIDDGSTYYTLGYTPENKDWNGKFRKISVKVNHPGAKLHYRLGYFAQEARAYSTLDSRQRASDFSQALGLEMPVSTQLLFHVAVLPPSDKTNKVIINYAIDAHTVSFEAGEDGLQRASVDCAAAVYTAKGESLKADSNGITAALTPENYQKMMQRYLPCSEAIDLPPGDYVLRVGVRDNRTGLIGTANASVSVAPAVPVSGKNGHN